MGTLFFAVAYALFYVSCTQQPYFAGCFAKNMDQPTTTSADHPNISASAFSNVSSVGSTTATSSIEPQQPSTHSAPSLVPTSLATPSSTTSDIWTMQTRRLSSIIGAMSSPKQIDSWLASLGSNGKWPDTEVDYTTGCDARRANWPAQDHWQRTLVMAGAWHGGLKGADQYVKSASLRSSISKAMGYWFSRDFSNVACLDSGGTSSCPCTNTENSLWNTNWFSNLILIPEVVSQVCLLLNNTLVPTELGNCTHFTSRAYATFDRNINGVGTLTGANALDVAKIGIDQSLLTVNATLLTDAYRRVHSELQVKNGTKVDGIRADGAFAQHSGMLYNGNYGKDYSNDLLDLEIEAGNTQFAAGSDARNTFDTLFNGNKWMIFRNTVTKVLHWDFSALGRFISFPVADLQATGNIKMNLTEVLELGQRWTSSALVDFANSLTADSPTANAGSLIGNHIFYTTDYMVHRGANYVTSVKMYSKRTQNTECTNLQNPLGFHLSDGAQYTYLQGDEYEDISAAWDWNLIPGITTDYQGTPLACETTQQTGVEVFVGGASDGKIGLAALRYTNPVTKALRFQKTWFFLEDDVQHVMINILASPSTTPLFSVLDQKRFRGTVTIDDKTSTNGSGSYSRPQRLWHGDVGYAFPDVGDAIGLTIRTGEKTGTWSAIGTSTQPPTTVNLFAAWIEHKTRTTPLSYTVFPGTTLDGFKQKCTEESIQAVRNDQTISAVYHSNRNVAMAVFWDPRGGSATFNLGAGIAPVTLTTANNIAAIYRTDKGQVTVSDPSQTLSTVQVTLSLGTGNPPPQWGQGRSKVLNIKLPSGGEVGNSITQSIN